jgi:cell shape-determining protein MreC
MSYHNAPKIRNNKKRDLIITASVIVVLFFIEYISPNVFSNVTFFVAKPFWKSKDYLAQVISKNELFHFKSTLIEQNNNLQKENDSLKDKVLLSDMLISENSNLKALLGAGKAKAGIGAPVVLTPFQSPYDLLIVSTPKDSNIISGYKVVSGNTALGIVVDTVGTNTKIQLYSSGGVETGGRLTKNGTSVVLTGKGGGNFSVFVPRDLDIIAGDIVEIPGDPVRALARVASVESTETDSFKMVKLISPVNIFSLSWVSILYEN